MLCYNTEVTSEMIHSELYMKRNIKINYNGKAKKPNEEE